MGAKPDEVRERERLQGDRRVVTATNRDVVPKDYRADNKSPEEIRADIARTRAEMSRTVDQLQIKLSPRRLRQQASDATIGRIKDMARNTAYEVSERTKSAGSTIVDTVRANPIPAALTALGLGWLIYESTGRSMRTRNVRQYPYPTGMYEREPGRVRETAGRVQERAGHVMGQAQERAGEMVDNVQTKAGEMVDTVQAKASDVVSQAQEQVHEIGQQAQELGQQAGVQIRNARNRVGQMIDENPLAAGVVALAIGAVVGMALPSTRQEQQLMGETRDRLVDRVQEAGQETMEKVQHVAREVTETAKETAKEEAKKEGLTPKDPGILR